MTSSNYWGPYANLRLGCWCLHWWPQHAIVTLSPGSRSHIVTNIYITTYQQNLIQTVRQSLANLVKSSFNYPCQMSIQEVLCINRFQWKNWGCKGWKNWMYTKLRSHSLNYFLIWTRESESLKWSSLTVSLKNQFQSLPPFLGSTQKQKKGKQAKQ